MNSHEGPDSVGQDRDRPFASLSYKQAKERLEQIVAALSGPEVDVDQLSEHLRVATALIEELETRIAKARAEVEELVPET
jgi:exodeoxyribonuclease VII small subunit